MIAIGGSAGALETMIALAAAFPAGYGGALFIVSHIGAHRSHLPDLLSRSGQLSVAQPQDGERIRPGMIYVAPPDRHMLVRAPCIRLSRGPRQHFTRPAIDPLFGSLAESFGPRVIGVVLSGSGSDGAAGLEMIQRAGGLAVVQDPATSIYPDMPGSAIAAISVDHIVGQRELPALLGV